MTLKIWWWGSSNAWGLGNMENFFIYHRSWVHSDSGNVAPNSVLLMDQMDLSDISTEFGIIVPDISHAVRVFANGPGDLGSIPGRCIIRYGSRVKWSNLGKGVAPSPTPWCSKLSKREPSLHPTDNLALLFECSLVVRETRIQSQVGSY